MKKITALTLTFINLLFSSSIQANSLEDTLRHFKTLNVRFAQNEGDNSQVSYGTLIVKVPGKFIWQNENKEQQDIIADGEKIWIYEKDLDQVSVYNQKEILINTPAVLISAPEDFKSNFTIDQQREEDDGIWYGLSPQQKNSYYDYIEVYIKANKIQQFHILNRLNNSLTRIEFYYSENSINSPIADERFNFIAPDGVDVLQ